MELDAVSTGQYSFDGSESESTTGKFAGQDTLARQSMAGHPKRLELLG